MGCVATKEIPSTPEEKARSREIESQLRKDAKVQRTMIRMLLLGAGDTGKSTFLKQVNLLHGSGDLGTPLENKKMLIRNIIFSIQALIGGCEQLGTPLSAENKDRAAKLSEIYTSDSLPADIVQDIVALWQDPGIQQVAQRANEINIGSNFKYFMDNILRLTDPESTPTAEDIILCRTKTTGVSEFSFQYKSTPFCIVDVGGQRSERRKWIHSFEAVNMLLFFVSLGEYDQKLEEDPRVNRMSESIRLFSEIVTSKWFASVPLALILNKRDILLQKIQVRDLRCAFPEYAGGLDYDNAVHFITDKFKQLCSPQTDLFIHVTCATDSNCIKDVFQNLASSILSTSLQGL